MKCPGCTFENPVGMAFCGKCGTSLAGTCPQCGFENPAEFEFCGKCGATLTEQPSATQSPVSPEAERRQLTVMFCDMVGSTALSTRLDPEDYREVIRAYQDACAGVIARYDGYVAKFMGDGVLAYFGWPRGHEDDAERAISAGLGVIGAVGDIALADGESEPLAVRIGVATGPVVVGDIVGEGAAQETAVTGETPNLAARLQEIAEPNTIAIAATTHALAGGLFAYETLGGQSFKGIDGSTEVWRVIAESRVESRFAAAHTTALTPLIGRDEELELLSRRWERAKAGDGQVVLLSGEPGIGKSRLTRALQDWMGDEPHTRLLFQCSPHHTSSALYPTINQLEIAARFDSGDDPNARLDMLEALLAQSGQPTNEAMPLIAALLSIPADDRHPLPELTPQRQKDRTLTALVDQLVGLAAQQPVLFVFEDAHWIDPTSLELLELVIERITELPVLIVVTYRPEFTAPWIGVPHVTLQALNRLTPQDSTRMTERLIGERNLPPEILTQIAERTDGVPLFIEELTRSVVDLGVAANGASGDTTANIVVPATLQDALEARFDRSPEVREVAQVGATIGREFQFDLLARVASLTTAELDAALGDLAGSGLLFARGAPPNASYTFKHALVQDAAYESLLRSRRQELHRRVAMVLVEEFPGSAETEPEIVAHHFTEAGVIRSAIDYWRRAGQRAAERSANGEAVSHFNRALTLLLTLPEGAERDSEELDLQIALTGPVTGFLGYTAPETERMYARALELCEQVGESPKIFPVLFGQFSLYIAQGQVTKCLEIAEEFLRRAERLDDGTFRMIGHRLVGTGSLMTGKLAAAIAHLDRAIAMYDVDRHRVLALTYAHDTKVAALCLRSLALWLQGYPDRAKASAEAGLDLAATLSHATTIGYAQVIGGGYLYSLCRDDSRVRHYAEATVAFSEETAMPSWAAVGRWAMASITSGPKPSEADLVAMRRALAALEELRWGLFLPLMLGQLAEAQSRAGNQQEAMRALDRARAVMRETGDRIMEPELHRIEGVLLLVGESADQDRAEDCYHRAIEASRQQEAKSWELRAATSLARLWRNQGKSQDAYNLLSPIYDWFTEGFDTADLKDAKVQLDELS